MIRGVLCSLFAVAVLSSPALAKRPSKTPAAAHKHKVAQRAKARHAGHHHKHHAKPKKP